MLRKLLVRLHPEGIPWPAAILYNRVSRTFIFQDHYRLVTEDIASRCPQGSLLDVGTGASDRGPIAAGVVGWNPGVAGRRPVAHGPDLRPKD